MTDWIPELDDDDLNTLVAGVPMVAAYRVDALEAWESKDQAAEMFGEIMDSVLGAQDPRAATALGDRRQTERQRQAREKRVRKERSVLLRAKLLTLRNRRRVERSIRANAEPEAADAVRQSMDRPIVPLREKTSSSSPDPKESPHS